jgi:hypothetical protein
VATPFSPSLLPKLLSHKACRLLSNRCPPKFSQRTHLPSEPPHSCSIPSIALTPSPHPPIPSPFFLQNSGTPSSSPWVSCVLPSHAWLRCNGSSLSHGPCRTTHRPPSARYHPPCHLIPLLLPFAMCIASSPSLSSFLSPCLFYHDGQVNFVSPRTSFHLFIPVFIPTSRLGVLRSQVQLYTLCLCRCIRRFCGYTRCSVHVLTHNPFRSNSFDELSDLNSINASLARCQDVIDDIDVRYFSLVFLSFLQLLIFISPMFHVPFFLKVCKSHAHAHTFFNTFEHRVLQAARSFASELDVVRLWSQAGNILILSMSQPQYCINSGLDAVSLVVCSAAYIGCALVVLPRSLRLKRIFHQIIYPQLLKKI